MQDRDLFQNIMHYGAFDRMLVWHWTGWPETIERWVGEGMPRDVDQSAYFKVSPLPPGVPMNCHLFPLFEEQTIEETDEYRILRQADGVVAQHFKNRSALPHYVDFTLKDRQGWLEYEKRLQPDPARIPADIAGAVAPLAESGAPVSVFIGSLAGWIRDWMGVENFCMTCCVDPDLIADIVRTMANLTCWCLDQVLPHVKVDMGWGWEDICFRTGPLVNPDLFREIMAPGYVQITEKLRSYGCDLCVVDCDGYIDDLVPAWLDSGVNVMFPLEIGAWKADPMAYRKKYGKDLRIIGGFDKLVLERGRDEIDAELERRRPLMADGGFIAMPDHLITPDTPLDNYKYYLERLSSLRF